MGIFRELASVGHDVGAVFLLIGLATFLPLGVGPVDTLMVSYAGETVVSGVALVNLISMVYLSIFAL